ncbi:hypothetical protein A2U01_0042510 [Trifolium medium]|uniref:Uncharacterized protein n=1 Tax=Trifolium medium TaxID=97028 RepID=A0A392QAD1_9FABA|nr:hypothetical protein [Trifolium medium]
MDEREVWLVQKVEIDLEVEIEVLVEFLVLVEVDVLVEIQVRHLLNLKKMLSHCIRIRCFTKFGDTFRDNGFSLFIKFSSVYRCG